MLRLLSIGDFATIDQLVVELAPGFTALTGETGAGKSIIVDALGLLLGGRADPAIVRAGASRARVEGVFSLATEPGERLLPLLEEAGVQEPGDELILAREVGREGRSTCRVNARIVPLRLLTALGERLVDIHGQGQHVSLLRVREQLEILDRYAGLGPARAAVATEVRRLREVRRNAVALLGSERERARELDLLRYQIAEIEAAQLSDGEDDELARERTLAANSERLKALADEAYRALYDAGVSPAVVDLLGRVAQATGQLERLDPSLEAARAAAEALLYQAEELARSLQSYRDRIDYDPQRLVQLEERHHLLSQLKRRYGDTVAEVRAFAALARADVERLSHAAAGLAALAAQERELSAGLGVLTGELSQARREAGTRLAAAGVAEARELALDHVRLEVAIAQVEADDGLPSTPPAGGLEDTGPPRHESRRLAFDETGVDRIEFLLSANPGEPLRSLVHTASGGEAARLMLALKVALALADPIPALVFDEVDAGVGGRIGAVLGRKLWHLARRHQVLCVTHLPQVACYADAQLRVTKAVAGGRTVTALEALDRGGRVTELAQMLGATTETGRRNAQEMLREATAWKKGSAGVPVGRAASDAAEAASPPTIP